MMQITHVNVRSLTQNFIGFRDRVLDGNPDIVAVSETWLTGDLTDEMVNMNGYNLVRRDRSDGRRGGGVALYIRNSFSFQVVCDFAQHSSEQLWVKVQCNGKSFAIGVWYRAGGFPLDLFFDEFEDCLSSLTPQCDTLVCAGDLNINCLDINGSNTRKLNELLYSYNLKQVVSEPTRLNSLLDLFIISNEIDCRCIVLHTPEIADHDMVICQMSLPSTQKIKKIITFRDFNNFDQELFTEHLSQTPFNDIFHLHSINDKVQVFNDYLLLLFDIHAPLKTVKVNKPKVPWLTDTIKSMMVVRDKALASYRRTGGNNHFNFYKSMRNQVNRALKSEKKAYLQNQIGQSRNSRNIWKKFKTIGVRFGADTPAIPPCLQDVNNINNHFVNNYQSHSQVDADLLHYFSNCKFDKSISFDFQFVTQDEVYRELLTFESNAVGVDKIPLKFLLHSCPNILPYITHIINYCLETSTFPDLWKISAITALPKCNNPSSLSDLRPISILCMLSKLTEKIMNNQLKLYFNSHNLLPTNQSGFRKDYSCNTALLHVTDDILRATDDGKLTVLVLLDFSKAFDRVSHELMLSILGYYGLSLRAVELLSSYLLNRKQCVRLGGESSDLVDTISGVPQGAIASPNLFSIYTSKLKEAFQYCNSHYYADDTQVYLSFGIGDVDSACRQINEDLARLTELVEKYCLTLNAAKSKVLLFGRKSQRNEVKQRIKISVNGEVLELIEVARNLGLELDTDFHFQTHVNKCIKKAFINLKMIYQHKDYLSMQNRLTLCESLVLSHFNFADVIYGPCLSGAAQSRIQKMQNSCVRLICGIRKYDHISHKYSELGIMRMDERRFLHSCCVFHKIIREKTPPYLCNKIRYRTDVHNINVRHKNSITIPAHRTKLFQSSFSYRIAKIYNNLPHHTKSLNNMSFKIAIKNLLRSKKVNVV